MSKYILNSKGATEHPTVKDIAWAAGIFEGEGCAYRYKGYERSILSVAQKCPWILYKLQSFFGGRVNTRKDGISIWTLHGGRARGFGMTIYGFLSPRRKEQLLRIF